jgi:hypothetical protein
MKLVYSLAIRDRLSYFSELWEQLAADNDHSIPAKVGFHPARSTAFFFFFFSFF